MSKGKDSSPAETAGGEEFSVEKVLDRRVVKGKVCNFNIYIYIHTQYLKIVFKYAIYLVYLIIINLLFLGFLYNFLLIYKQN